MSTATAHPFFSMSASLFTVLFRVFSKYNVQRRGTTPSRRRSYESFSAKSKDKKNISHILTLPLKKSPLHRLFSAQKLHDSYEALIFSPGRRGDAAENVSAAGSPRVCSPLWQHVGQACPSSFKRSHASKKGVCCSRQGTREGSSPCKGERTLIAESFMFLAL